MIYSYDIICQYINYDTISLVSSLRFIKAFMQRIQSLAAETNAEIHMQLPVTELEMLEKTKMSDIVSEKNCLAWLRSRSLSNGAVLGADSLPSQDSPSPGNKCNAFCLIVSERVQGQMSCVVLFFFSRQIDSWGVIASWASLCTHVS